MHKSLSVAESRASACALILCIIPGCRRKGQAYSGYTHCGQKGSDGLGGRLLCGLVLAGLSHYAQGHPTHRGPVGSPPCSVSSLVDGCAAPLPRSRLDRCDDAVKQRDNSFNWGIASVNFGSTYTQNDLPVRKGVDSRPS